MLVPNPGRSYTDVLQHGNELQAAGIIFKSSCLYLGLPSDLVGGNQSDVSGPHLLAEAFQYHVPTNSEKSMIFPSRCPFLWLHKCLYSVKVDDYEQRFGLIHHFRRRCNLGYKLVTDEQGNVHHQDFQSLKQENVCEDTTFIKQKRERSTLLLYLDPIRERTSHVFDLLNLTNAPYYDYENKD